MKILAFLVKWLIFRRIWSRTIVGLRENAIFYVFGDWESTTSQEICFLPSSSRILIHNQKHLLIYDLGTLDVKRYFDRRICVHRRKFVTNYYFSYWIRINIIYITNFDALPYSFNIFGILNLALEMISCCFLFLTVKSCTYALELAVGLSESSED